MTNAVLTLLVAAGLAMSQLQGNILQLLQITPSEESVNYVTQQQQFHLHKLVTEQRHPKTWNLSSEIKANTLTGIESLLSVDEDVSNKFREMSVDTRKLDQAVNSVKRAIVEGHKVYIYGCGATGRLAKEIESSVWRPFWNKHEALRALFPNIENRLIGEMTGADRALISSLEGLEDLQLIGRLQLEEHGIKKGDVVFCVTEGGETSSVIGTVLTAAAKEIDSYFIYNNPDEVLQPLHRSREVLDNQAITKICLCTGPQSITGSTRMQATTSETFVVGIILEQAITEVLKDRLTTEELLAFGFDPTLTIKDRLLSFIPIQQAVYQAKESISQLTDLESSTYANNHFSTYFAKKALITVFTDVTERSPTFKLFPLDTVREPQRKAWMQVWTEAADGAEAWLNFLKRPFHGLRDEIYKKPFSEEISDPFLTKAALSSLGRGGDEQQHLYDFSFSPSKEKPKAHDLGVAIVLEDEFEDPSFDRFLSLFTEQKASVALLLIPSKKLDDIDPVLVRLKGFAPDALILQVPVESQFDPLQVRQDIAVKMLLNAHSTGTMAKLGRVIGNTMATVSASNLKLYGRATFLILGHVNDHLPVSQKLTYEEANAVLFDAIAYVKTLDRAGQTSEVALSIIRILETLKESKPISWIEADQIFQSTGLEAFLFNLPKFR